MKRISGFAAVLLLLPVAACRVDSGPTQTSSAEVDAGAAESVAAEINMGAGELRVNGGAPKLMSASFRYSESVGRPKVHYDVTGSHGRLTVESPKSASTGHSVNQWTLQLGSGVPLDLKVNLGAGESNLDLSKVSLRSLDVNIGAGEMSLNVSGDYKHDVNATVNGGVGQAKITLPKNTPVEVSAEGGLGSINAKGLEKRADGKYYNAAYAEGKPAIHMQVHGGIGEIDLNVAGDSGVAN